MDLGQDMLVVLGGLEAEVRQNGVSATGKLQDTMGLVDVKEVRGSGEKFNSGLLSSPHDLPRRPFAVTQSEKVTHRIRGKWWKVLPGESRLPPHTFQRSTLR